MLHNYQPPACLWLYWPILGFCHIPIGKKVVIKVQINWLKCLFIPAPRSVQAIWSEKVRERSSYLFRILVGPYTTKFSTTIFAVLYWLLEWCKTILLLFLVRPWCLMIVSTNFNHFLPRSKQQQQYLFCNGLRNAITDWLFTSLAKKMMQITPMKNTLQSLKSYWSYKKELCFPSTLMHTNKGVYRST